jgi:hypothetical protein
MVKRLNFLTDSAISGMSENLDLTRSNYKDALDLAINKSLSPTDFIKPGPYLGIVLRREPTPSKQDIPLLKSWISRFYGTASETESPIPDALMAYKIRIPELDACLPEPPTNCQSIEEESESQKYIELHTTFYAKESGAPEANPGDVVWVDFADYKTRDEPVYLGPCFSNQGQVSSNPGDPLAKPSAAFDKCADVSFEGAPEGSNLMSTELFYTDGTKNRFIGENELIEQEQVESNEPRNTYPRECSTRTSTGLSNEPDNVEEEENLLFLEQEVIPRLLPALREIDGRFVVTSVYRSDEVNTAVGGHPSSWHAKGLGVDFGGLASLPKADRDSIMVAASKHLQENKSKFPFLRTIIVETFRNHIHIDVYPQGSQGSAKFKVWRLKDLPLENL